MGEPGSTPVGSQWLVDLFADEEKKETPASNGHANGVEKGNVGENGIDKLSIEKSKIEEENGIGKNGVEHGANFLAPHAA